MVLPGAIPEVTTVVLSAFALAKKDNVGSEEGGGTMVSAGIRPLVFNACQNSGAIGSCAYSKDTFNS